ncbi:hypothetical protein BaRGS_00025273 [Batillaria attramentaria]|uniref:Carboxylesterase type B domain-containing protein n=1 Tax=Batillaria attramentaria TaxID=370345 RepID=A0ABD0K8N4_9CAEN
MATRPVLVILVLIGWTAASVNSEMVVVNTPDGALRGRRASFMGKTINTFLGIPFGHVPQRFLDPSPAANWSGVRDALSFGAMCPQLPVSLVLPASEDCLFLNVYTPEPEDPKEALPVMVWIHGGGYQTGTGAYYNGTALAAKGVVVVTINYRLDLFGFLSTEDFGCPGNMGLLDQLLALKWVKKSIASFHGNPSDVTIFGESAGSSSVSLLRLSPMSQGLFSKAIMESGVSLSPWAVGQSTDVTRPSKWAAMLGNEMGCSENTTARNNGNFVFKPVVEKTQGVLPLPPIEMLAQRYGSDVISLHGVNKDENSLFYFKDPLSYFTQANLETQLTTLTNAYFARDPAGAKDAMVKEYFKGFNSSTEEQLRSAAIQLMTDVDFVAPTVLEMHMVLNASKAASQYFYEYVYRPTNYNVPQWAGVPHASELPIVFGQPFELDRFFAHDWNFPWTAADKTVSDEVMTMWTNFAKYGKPTPQAVGHVTWPPYTMEKQNYVEIGNLLSIKTDLKAQQVQFWIGLWSKRT